MNGDFLTKLKRFFKNKNTITIVGVAAVLGLLYWGYSMQVKSSVNPVKVPVAAVTIQPRTLITNDMVTYIDVPYIAVSDNAYNSGIAVVGKYTAVNTVIPKGSMFYFDTVVDKNALPDAAFFDIKDGYIPYMFNVSLNSTYGNSIYPKSKIDIYMKANDVDGKIMIGKLLQDVEVVAVKDDSGLDVFEDSSTTRSPAYLIFGLEEEYHILLRKASYISDIDLIPVPHGGTVKHDGDIEYGIEALVEYINSKSVILPGQEGTTVEKTDDKSTDESSKTDKKETTTKKD